MDLRCSQSMAAPSSSSPPLQPHTATTRPADPLSFDFLTDSLGDAHKSTSAESNFFLPACASTAVVPVIPTSPPLSSPQRQPSSVPTAHQVSSPPLLVHPRPPRQPTSESHALQHAHQHDHHHNQIQNQHQQQHHQQHHQQHQQPKQQPQLQQSVVSSGSSPTPCGPVTDPFADPIALYTALHGNDAPQLSKAQRRRLRILLRARRHQSRRRCVASVRSDGLSRAIGNGCGDVAPSSVKRRQDGGATPQASCSSLTTAIGTPSSTSSSVITGNAASIKDKKAARVIRNREVALRARQMAKLKMKNLESENCSLKSRATSLESENLTLRSYVHRLTGGRGPPLPLLQSEAGQNGQAWPHDVVSMGDTNGAVTAANSNHDRTCGGGGVVGAVPQ